MKKMWNNEEVLLLRKLYADGLSLSDIESYFPYRTNMSIKSQIKKQIRKFGLLPHTKEQKKKIWSKVRLGNKNPHFKKSPPTKGFTKNTLLCLKIGSEKLSKIIKEKVTKGEWIHTRGPKNGMYGKPSWCKGLTKNNCEKLKMAGKKCSKTKKLRYKYLSNEEKEKIRQRIIKSMTEKTKYKMRISAIKRMKNSGILACRNFNPKACEYFDKLNKERGWNLQHAKNGGEIEIYGYFLDAYDKYKNLVVEYDEPRHDRPQIKKKDEIRQNNIINYLKCKFYRYKELDDQLIEIV